MSSRAMRGKYPIQAFFKIGQEAGLGPMFDNLVNNPVFIDQPGQQGVHDRLHGWFLDMHV